MGANIQNALQVSTFNCHGFKSCSEYIRVNILKIADIVALQETWLMPYEVALPDGLSESHCAFSTSSVQVEEALVRGRPYGGLSFLWSERLAECVNVVQYADDRILGLQMADCGFTTLFLNIYMPTQCPENHDSYLSYIGKIEGIIRDSNADSICMLGDFNAQPGSAFYEHWESVCEDLELCVVDVQHLPPDSYTHINSGNCGTSWVDHIVVSNNFVDSVYNCEIDYGVSVSDHFPVTCIVSNISRVHEIDNVDETLRVNWKFTDVHETERFFTYLDELLCDVSVNLPQCFNEENCNNRVHLNNIETFYKNIMTKIILAGLSVFGRVRAKTHSNVPGWTERVSSLHSEARRQFLCWRRAGSPRVGELAQNMRGSRARFKLALRRCRQEEDKIRSDKLARKLLNGECRDFWKGIKSLCPNKVSLPGRVDNAHGSVEVAAMWGQKFECILNSVQNDSLENEVMTKVSVGCNSDVVSLNELKECLRQLPCGKAAGNDDVPVEVYKYAPQRLLILLCILFTACLRHSYLPKDMIEFNIIPLIKSKLKDPGLSDNFRPISIATAISKVFEKILFKRMIPYLQTTDNQFGFKQSHSTDLCILTLKEIVNFYKTKGSPVFLCFLDLEKAFDRVNHFKLFNILLKRGMPHHLIRSLVYWYRNQGCRVKWGSQFSGSFGVTNGIKQGGLISPYLFNVYMDDLSRRLGETSVGCFVGDVCVNHLAYADDMVLLAPCVRALQKLLEVCEDYALEFDIRYQTTKSMCMVVWPNKYWLRFDPTIFLNGVSLKFVTEFKYLGHILANTGKDDADMVANVRSLYATGNMLVRRFSKCSESVKIALFRAYCYNVYCCGLWSQYALASWRRMKVAHNDVFRNLMVVPRFASASELFVRNNVNNLDVLVRKSMYSILSRVKKSENLILNAVYNSECRIVSKIFNNINAKLFLSDVLFVL